MTTKIQEAKAAMDAANEAHIANEDDGQAAALLAECIRTRRLYEEACMLESDALRRGVAEQAMASASCLAAHLREIRDTRPATQRTCICGGMHHVAADGQSCDDCRD